MTAVFTPPPGGSENGVGDCLQEEASDNSVGEAQGRDSLDGGKEQGQVIVDGLLCSVIKAISRSPKESELIAAIDRVMMEVEIKASWWKLFSFYSDAWDEGRKMKIKDIKRKSNKLMIEDMVSYLKKTDIGVDHDMFVLPWYYTMKTFETDSQRMSNVWEKETAQRK